MFVPFVLIVVVVVVVVVVICEVVRDVFLAEAEGFPSLSHSR